MTNIVSRIAGLATLALATLPIAAITTAAHAAPVAVKVADLNLNSAAGLAVFHQRAESAAHDFCREATQPVRRIGALQACRTAVKTEIAEKLVVAQNAQLGRSTAYASR